MKKDRTQFRSIWAKIYSDEGAFFGFAIAFCAMVLLYVCLTIQPEEFLWNIYYTRMAVNPFMGEPSPWAYRILTSLLVYGLPLSIPTGFLVVNTSALFLSALTLIGICRQMGLRKSLCLLSVIPFLLSSGVEWQWKAIFYNDAISYLLLSLTVYTFLQGKDCWVSALSTIGVLNRSTALYFFPVWYVVRFGVRINRKSLSQTAIVWGPPILLTVLIHSIWYPLTYYPYKLEISQEIQASGFAGFFLTDFFRNTQSFLDIGKRLFSPHLFNVYFGTLLPSFLLGLFVSNSVYRRLSLWMLIVWFQFIVAWDIGRLETYAFPILIPLALLYYQEKTQGLPFLTLYDELLGILLFLFPRNIYLGILIAFCLWIRNGSPKESLKNASIKRPIVYLSMETIQKRRMLPFGLIGIVFIGFSLFCYQTYRLRPIPFMSFPPALLEQEQVEYEVNLIDKNGDIIEKTVATREIDSSVAIQLGNPDQQFEQIAFMVPNRDRTPKQILLFMWGSGIKGKYIYLQPGTLVDRRSPPMEMGYQAIENNIDENIFCQSFLIPMSEENNCFLIGRGNTWQGSFKFIAFDATELIRKNKDNRHF